ncbi:LacI family DNA-binding transcriptional regulator [soil metagenome]
MQSRVTIGDVAAKAGVSKVTVSYVLNGRGADARIKPATVERVSAIAKELGYQRNAVAAMLKRKRSYAVAVAFQYADLFGGGSDFTNEVMRGVCEAAQQHDYDLMLHTRVVDSPEEEVGAFADGRVDGVLILRDGDHPTLRLLHASRVPCVSFFCAAGPAWVDADNQAGGALAVSHLAELGHRRLLFLRGSEGSVASNERMLGAQAEAQRLGLPEPCAMAFVGEDWRTVLMDKNRPTGIVAWSDDAAAEIQAFLTTKGIDCPGKVSLVGFDSLSLAERAGITSVAQPVRQIATEAFSLLIDCIDERERCRTVRFPVRLDIRGTTGPAPAASFPRTLKASLDAPDLSKPRN